MTGTPNIATSNNRPNRIWRWTMRVMTIAIAFGFVIFWFSDTVPREIRIATGPEGGLYHNVGKYLQNALQEQTRRSVRLIPTVGTVANRQKLLDDGDPVHLAIIQDGAVPMKRLSVVAPLYRDVVLVIVRRASGIATISDLRGRRVALGPPGSGMRESARVVLGHFGIRDSDLLEADRYFGELRTDETLTAAVVTTGLLNHDLQGLMATRQFDILALPDADALSMYHPYFMSHVIPAGAFEGFPPLPETPVATVATTAVLACRENLHDRVVKMALAAVYERDLRDSVPTLIPQHEARQARLANLHPATRTYYDPYGGVELISNLLESVSAIKELLFAVCAGLFLAWGRWRQIQERKNLAAVTVMKERLDTFLEQTIRVERRQMETDDPLKLREYLDEVTRIKLQAISELTHEDLRGDRMFSIFLLQCGDLAVKIQSKLTACLSRDQGIEKA